MEIKRNDDAIFLPFMQIPTGHHHVADAVMEELQGAVTGTRCGKVDILSYSYGKLEKLVSSTYLYWIKRMPGFYDSLYNRLAVKNQTKRSRQFLYEILFTTFFKKMMRQNQPNIVFCTHCLPSNIAGVLKEKGVYDFITVNVYTDYFVNRVWGIKGIDYHFVPSIRVKQFLLNLGVDERRIYVTGIPVHPIFQKKAEKQQQKTLQVLVTGGSLGVGSIERIIPSSPTIKLIVLCGHNQKLYEKLCLFQNANIEPIQYINNKPDINMLYNQVDAVITKPGGVTISECLMKRIPIFTSDALPGQEKVNELELKKLGVINQLDPSKNMEQQIIDYFQDDEKQEEYKKCLDTYHQHLEQKSMSDILLEIWR